MPGSEKVERFFDIERAVEEWGLVMFERNARTRKQKKLKKKHFVDNIPCIEVQIDWSHLSVTHRTAWGQIKDGDFDASSEATPNGTGDADNSSPKPADVKDIDVNVLFQTDFSNDTSKDQTYNLRIEKTTRSTCTTEIENGVTNGVELSATLSVGDILEVGAGFSREVSITKMEGETLESEVTWGAESSITVPAQKSAKAEMQVLEKQQSGDFTVFTTMIGYVKIKYISLKDNSLLFSQTGKIKFVVDEYVKQMKSLGKQFYKGIEYKDDGSVVFQTKGKCSFRYGVKQQIKVVQSDQLSK